MLTVQIHIRNVYGEEKAYPVGHEAECFARLAGTKTLTRNALGHILHLGLTIVEVDRHGKPCRTFRGVDSMANLPVHA